MKCYLLNHPRPMGLEPTIYLTKPIIEENDENPFSPSVLECDNVFEAKKQIFEYNSAIEYRNEFKIRA